MSTDQPLSNAARHVFVYGTLRRGGINDITRLLPTPRFVGTARVRGVLYHLGAYPGLTLGGDQWVLGEVYAIEPALEPILDDIEDLGSHPTDEYIKRDVLVEMDGGSVACLIYEINPKYALPALRVHGGDWLEAIS